MRIIYSLGRYSMCSYSLVLLQQFMLWGELYVCALLFVTAYYIIYKKIQSIYADILSQIRCWRWLQLPIYKWNFVFTVYINPYDAWTSDLRKVHITDRRKRVKTQGFSHFLYKEERERSFREHNTEIRLLWWLVQRNPFSFYTIMTLLWHTTR